MSVVSGAVVFDGIVLTADCRSTYRRQGKTVHVDNVQKIIPLSPHVATGFAGNVLVAGRVLLEAKRQLQRGRSGNKLHPIVLIDWFPRFLRHAYATISSSFQEPRVDFLLAAVIRARPNVVDRSRVVELMERFRLGTLSHQRSWLPGILVRILSTPPSATKIVLGDYPACFLAVLEAPHFVPQPVPTLGFTAIGSGAEAVSQIHAEADWIFAGDVGNSFVEGEALARAVQNWIDENGIDDVGGMFPRAKLNAKGYLPMGLRTEIPVGGAKIELVTNGVDKWVQRNLSTGKEIPLSLPWEITATVLPSGRTFNDYHEAMRSFRGKS